MLRGLAGKGDDEEFTKRRCPSRFRSTSLSQMTPAAMTRAQVPTLLPQSNLRRSPNCLQTCSQESHCVLVNDASFEAMISNLISCVNSQGTHTRETTPAAVAATAQAYCREHPWLHRNHLGTRRPSSKQLLLFLHFLYHWKGYQLQKKS